MNSDETRTLSDPRLLWVQEQAEGDDLLVADGFDEAILGIAQRCGQRFVVYDQAKVIEVLQRDTGMSTTWLGRGWAMPRRHT